MELKRYSKKSIFSTDRRADMRKCLETGRGIRLSFQLPTGCAKYCIIALFAYCIIATENYPDSGILVI